MSYLLIVEDNQELADALQDALGIKYQVTHVSDLAAAKIKLAEAHFDLLILDVSLPDGSGFELCEYMKTQNFNKVPVIFLTGEDDLDHRMKGLALGAQDYILKPFYTKELSLRVEMRLQQAQEMKNVLVCGDLKFERNLQNVFLLGDHSKNPEAIKLTPNEYKIMLYLAVNSGEVVTRLALVDSVWGAGFSISDKAVNSHISNLRKKIGSQRCQIVAVEGKGYILRVTP